MTFGAEKFAGNARADDEFDTTDLVDVKQCGEFAECIAGDALWLLNEAAATADRAVGEVQAFRAGTHALTRHLEDAELRDRGDRGAGAIALEAFAEPAFHFLAVRHRAHIDQVVDDNAALIAEAQLAADLVHRLEIGLIRIFLGIA